MQTKVIAFQDIATTGAEVQSSQIDISNADKVNIMLMRDDHISGSTAFKIYLVGFDGIPTLIQENQLIGNVVNANTETQVMSGTITL
jgi:hypothetical protein